MTLNEKVRLYIRNGILYERGEPTEISDTTWDNLSRILLKRYNKLPKWFRNKVSEEDLRTGSAAGFEEKFLCDIFEV